METNNITLTIGTLGYSKISFMSRLYLKSTIKSGKLFPDLGMMDHDMNRNLSIPCVNEQNCGC